MWIGMYNRKEDYLLFPHFQFKQVKKVKEMNDVKEWKIGSYKLIIYNKKFFKTNIKHNYSAALYKNGKLLTKFRASEPITEDNAFEFFLDQTLMKRNTQGLNFIEKN